MDNGLISLHPGLPPYHHQPFSSGLAGGGGSSGGLYGGESASSPHQHHQLTVSSSDSSRPLFNSYSSGTIPWSTNYGAEPPGVLRHGGQSGFPSYAGSFGPSAAAVAAAASSLTGSYSFPSDFLQQQIGPHSQLHSAAAAAASHRNQLLYDVYHPTVGGSGGGLLNGHRPEFSSCMPSSMFDMSDAIGFSINDGNSGNIILTIIEFYFVII